MSYADAYAVAVDPSHIFRKQLVGALHNIASDILTEPEDTDDHARRLTWARGVTASSDGPVVEAGRWVWLMLTDATLAAAPTTADDSAVKAVALSFLPTMLSR